MQVLNNISPPLNNYITLLSKLCKKLSLTAVKDKDREFEVKLNRKVVEVDGEVEELDLVVKVGDHVLKTEESGKEVTIPAFELGKDTVTITIEDNYKGKGKLTVNEVDGPEVDFRDEAEKFEAELETVDATANTEVSKDDLEAAITNLPEDATTNAQAFTPKNAEKIEKEITITFKDQSTKTVKVTVNVKAADAGDEK